MNFSISCGMHGETLDITSDFTGVTCLLIKKFVELIVTGWFVMISSTSLTLFRYM